MARSETTRKIKIKDKISETKVIFTPNQADSGSLGGLKVALLHLSLGSH